MTTPSRPRSDRIDSLLEEILTDAYGEDEQFWALLDAITEGLELPVEVTVVGQAFSLVGVDYDGNVRSGIIARVSMATDVSIRSVLRRFGSGGVLRVRNT